MEEYVDILLATYNGERYIKEQLDSLINQTYKNIKIFISDDCSKDGTIEILKEYEKKYKNIHVTYQKKNLGYIRNFEFLLKNVKDNFYMLSDQDDVWKNDKVQKSLDKLKNDNADLVFSDLEVVDQDMKLLSRSFNKSMKKKHKIKKALTNLDFEYLYNSITGCTILSKKEFIKKILPIPKESKYIIHDSWIGLMMSINGKITYLDEATIKYRQHNKNQIGYKKNSYKKFDDMRNLFIEVKKDLFRNYLKNNEKFPKELQKLNLKGKFYFENIENKNYINFRGWNVFHKLYKNETLAYYMSNFIILNIPIIGRMIYNTIKTLKIK